MNNAGHVLILSLVESCHEIPQAIDGAIFRQSDIDRAIAYLNKDKATLFAHVLETAAFNKVFNLCHDKDWTWIDPWWDEEDMIPENLPTDLIINLYVTGFTPALVAVINMCKYNNITLNTWHYNKDKEDYFYYPIA